MTGQKKNPRTVTKYPNAKPGSLEGNTKAVVEKTQPYPRPAGPKPTFVNAPLLDPATQTVLPAKTDQLLAQETVGPDDEESADTESSIETQPQEPPFLAPPSLLLPALLMLKLLFLPTKMTFLLRPWPPRTLKPWLQTRNVVIFQMGNL